MRCNREVIFRNSFSVHILQFLNSTFRFGPAKWRDNSRPSQILSKICKLEGLAQPSYSDDGSVCEVAGHKFVAESEICNQAGGYKAVFFFFWKINRNNL